jgi:hypothetical protein
MLARQAVEAVKGDDAKDQDWQRNSPNCKGLQATARLAELLRNSGDGAGQFVGQKEKAVTSVNWVWTATRTDRGTRQAHQKIELAIL